MPTSTVEIDLTITEAVVIGGRVARIGDRVKHFGERFTGDATATVIGFNQLGQVGPSRIKVIVKPDSPNSVYASFPGWDWDRTELISHRSTT